jgi:hypothetical protein
MHNDAIPAWINNLDPSAFKQCSNRSDLHRLDHPIRFRMELDLRKALPSDAHDLYDSLMDVRWGIDILPHALKDLPNVEIPNTYCDMWQSADKTLGEDIIKSLIKNYSCFKDIII